MEETVFRRPCQETMVLMSKSLGLDTEEVKSIWYHGTFLDIVFFYIMKVARCGKIH
jgi:hypothetical protein